MRALRKKLLNPKIPIIKIQGPIAQKTAQKFMNNLNNIDIRNTEALGVLIDSKGGSPVQADIIATRLRNFANVNKLKLITFVTDNALSAGYYILSVGDQIYADKTSLVGSIGVVAKKYDFSSIIQSYDVENIRIQIQKTILGMMDSATQLNKQDREYLQNLLKDTHLKFINHVKQHRKHKLNPSQDSILDGSIFTGQEALKYGLIDGLSNYTQVLNKKYPNCYIQIDNSQLRRLSVKLRDHIF